MTVKDVRYYIQKALDAKKDLDASAASMLQIEIDTFLRLFKTEMGKNIDTAKRSLDVTENVEEATNLLRQAYGV
ncbi:MAG: hypothetical protein WCH65_06650 [bacterium]